MIVHYSKLKVAITHEKQLFIDEMRFQVITKLAKSRTKF